jgi:uncharacterized protein YrrD
MIRATELSGRPVIDIDAAEKVGVIDKIILDPDGRKVAENPHRSRPHRRL